jgi:hypothetical protein
LISATFKHPTLKEPNNPARTFGKASGVLYKFYDAKNGCYPLEVFEYYDKK